MKDEHTFSSFILHPSSFPPEVIVRNPWILPSGGTILFLLVWYLQGTETGYWLPGLGLGIALVSWLGWRVLPLLWFALFVVRSTSAQAPSSWLMILGDTLLHTAQMGLSWWVYHRIANGSRWLDDPRSVTVFLILVPGGLSALFALLQGALWLSLVPTAEDAWWLPIAPVWLSRMVGILVVLPFLLVLITPALVYFQLVEVELPTAFFGETLAVVPKRGEAIELCGLTFATTLLAVLLLWTHVTHVVNWALWGCCLILIVWICIRQGLRGGCFARSE